MGKTKAAKSFYKDVDAKNVEYEQKQIRLQNENIVKELQDMRE